MKQDETDRPREVASGRPDLSFFERLEDDSLWQEQPRPVRRTDRYADRGGRRRSAAPRGAEESDYARRPTSKRTPPRSSRMALIVLLVAVVIVVVAGLGLSGSSGSQTSPFTLISLDGSAITTTTAVGEPSTSSTTATATSTTTTTTTTP
jgi:hypothetical protein